MNYTHFAYFVSRADADACAEAMGKELDCLAAVDKSFHDATAEDVEHFGFEPKWLLRPARSYTDPDAVFAGHKEARAVVERFNGFYDGGETTIILPHNGSET